VTLLPAVQDIDRITLTVYLVVVIAGFLAAWAVAITVLVNPIFDKRDREYVEQQRRERARQRVSR
jgi:hypothetical protein